jgi:hypothetical protein
MMLNTMTRRRPVTRDAAVPMATITVSLNIEKEVMS